MASNLPRSKFEAEVYARPANPGDGCFLFRGSLASAVKYLSALPPSALAGLSIDCPGSEGFPVTAEEALDRSSVVFAKLGSSADREQ